jgi:two-component system, chemotaxis family, sensor kinase CheA
MSIDLSRFNNAFFSEGIDSLDSAETCLLELEKGQTNEENLNALFRAVHSVKGTAGTLGFEEIAVFSHGLEELLEQLRRGAIVADPEFIDLSYAALDMLRLMIVCVRDQQPAVDASRVLGLSTKISHRLSHRTLEQSKNIQICADAVPEARALNYFEIVFSPHADFCAAGNDPLLYLRELGEAGRATVALDTSALPDLPDMVVDQAYLVWRIQLQTQLDEGGIRDIFEWVSDLCDLDISRVDSLRPNSQFEYQAQGATLENLVQGHEFSSAMSADDTNTSSQLLLGARAGEMKSAGENLGIVLGGTEKIIERRATTLHVRAERLDYLINQIGEIAIAHGMFKQELRELGVEGKVQTGINRLDRQLRELQDTVLSLRMLPLRILFARFERVVRDGAIEFGKKIKLVLEGTETELDKTLIEKLVDPVTHLVRNAIDHGLETVAQRELAGKDIVGTLVLSAKHEGGAVIVSVRDDGAGLPIEKIRVKAIILGLANESDQLSDQQWQQFVFKPGFSTSDQVSQWSGRGVGLDVVASSVGALGAELSVDSQPGLGTCFSMRVPLTLAIVDALLVQSQGQVYAIGLNFVRECLQAEHVELVQVNADQVSAKVRGQYLQVAFLSNLFNCTTSVAQNDRLTNSKQTYLVIEAGSDSFMLVIDAVLGQEQVVVRSLEKHFVNPPNCSGATIMGDGSVALILDAIALARSVYQTPVSAHVTGTKHLQRLANTIGLNQKGRTYEPIH